MRSRWSEVVIAALVGLVGLGASLGAVEVPSGAVAGAGGAPAASARAVTTEPVCFEVHVPGDLSVARGLARAGYVVVTYDPLGYHRSSYDLPQGGRLLSLGAHRGMLHEIVEQLRGGDYGTDGNCFARDGAMARVGSGRVVLMGHSTGAAIVGGYAGQ